MCVLSLSPPSIASDSECSFRDVCLYPQELTQEGSDAQPAAKRAKIDASDAAAPPPATHDPNAAAAAPPDTTRQRLRNNSIVCTA